MNSNQVGDDADGKVRPAARPKFFSHATLECRDHVQTRRFLEDFLGFEILQRGEPQPGRGGFWARLGRGGLVLVVIQIKNKQRMAFGNRNGLDVETRSDVDKAHAMVAAQAESWGFTSISKPAVQHGFYAFHFWDADENVWEIRAASE